MKYFLPIIFLLVLSYSPLAFAQPSSTQTGPPSSNNPPSSQTTSLPSTQTAPAPNNTPPLTQTAPAPNNTPQSSVSLINPLGAGTSIPTLLTDILQFVIQIGTVVIILMLVYVGYLFVVAQGNDSKLSEARKALLYTIIGALILLGSEAIAQGIQATVTALSVGS